jgi:hypothetical protein
MDFVPNFNHEVRYSVAISPEEVVPERQFQTLNGKWDHKSLSRPIEFKNRLFDHLLTVDGDDFLRHLATHLRFAGDVRSFVPNAADCSLPSLE